MSLADLLAEFRQFDDFYVHHGKLKVVLWRDGWNGWVQTMGWAIPGVAMHGLGRVTIARPGEKAWDFEQVVIEADHEEARRDLIELAGRAGEAMGPTLRERYGIAADMPLAARWLAFVALALKGRRPPYVTELGASETLKNGKMHSWTMVRPFEASALAIELAERGRPTPGPTDAAGMEPVVRAATPEPSTTAAHRKRDRLGSQAKIAQAMMLVKAKPDLSDADIAKRVGVHRSTLSRDETYQTGAKLARQQGYSVSKGYKSKEGDFDAEDEAD